MKAPDVLRRTAAAFRTGELVWGTGWFIGIGNDCRCALGGISYIADPGDPFGDPRTLAINRRAATDAMRLLADYLVDVLGAERVDDTDDTDGLIETVGRWNDAPGRETVDVVAALEGAAAHAEQVCR